jgi:glyceraldehyde-3-phosphate dehydrogenase (NAD(P))
MNDQQVRVAINGYGVIGKRVADAVALQDDMRVAGVADVVADYRIHLAAERGYALYGATGQSRTMMADAGLPVKGGLEDLLAATDVVVDCTPKQVAAHNREVYAAMRLKSIFQGGERHEVAGYSFVASANYAGAIGRDMLRVVSCNTTGLCRIAQGFHARGLIRKLRAVLVRRGTDPWESHLGGLINTIEPEARVPSHQGPDAQTVIPGLPVVTMAAKGPFNLSHIHFAMIETTREVAGDEALAILREAPRVAFVRAADGVTALNSVIELARDLGRPRGDLWEVAVWQDSLSVQGTEIFLTYQVHNEAIVIPETIDAIRALTGIETDGARSIAKTDAALGIRKDLLTGGRP